MEPSGTKLSVCRRLSEKLGLWRDKWIPGPAAGRGVAALAWITLLVFGGADGTGFRLGWGKWADVMVGVTLAAVVLLLARWTIQLLGWIGRWALRFLTLWGLAGVIAIAFAWLYAGLTWYLALGFGIAFGLLQVVLGAAVAHGLGGGPRAKTSLIIAVIVLGLNVSLIAVLRVEGMSKDPTLQLISPFAPTQKVYADLLEVGPWKVGRLTYAGGTDRRRPEYAGDSAFNSHSVDARRLLTGLKGWRATIRKALWGFGAEALPVNARVWYPQDRKDQAPLILIVHGNHSMMAYSDPGYAYLGEHLASRGFIVASVDENFLNSGAFVGGMAPENEVRGWLLLEHLRQWRQWNSDPKNPFFGRVDLNRVVLIGHSRGGEAVGIAAAFNSLKFYPDDARVSFDYNFGLRGVVAIAPVDGQYLPSQKRTPIRDVSYFVLHGGYDGDVSSYQGDKQYQRVSFTPGSGNFKAGLYVHHANHGQFNTSWGRSDRGAPGAWLLNLKPLMPPEDQRRIAKLFITAFVEERLLGRKELRGLFQEPTRAGDILPPTLYVGHYSDDQRRIIADFEDRIDVTRGNLPGSALSGEGLRMWKEADLHLRKDTQRYDTAAILGWVRGAEPAGSWMAKFPRQPGLGGTSTIELDLAQLDEEVPAGDETKKVAPPPHPAIRPAIELTVEVTDAAGRHAALPLSHFGQLFPPLPVRHSKLGSWASANFGKATEPVVHTMHLPLADFTVSVPDFDPSGLVSVRLIFDRADRGMIGLSEIALEP